MKRINISAFLCLILFAGCVKENIPEEVTPGVLTVRASASVSLSDTEIQWFASSDRIGVYAKETGKGEMIAENKYLAASSSTPRTLFKAISDNSLIELSDEEKLDLGIYYPYRSSYSADAVLPVSVPSFQTIHAGLKPEFKQENIFTGYAENVGMMESALEMELAPIASYLRIKLSSVSAVPFSSFRLEAAEGTVLAFEEGSYTLFDRSIDCGESISSKIEVKVSGVFISSSRPNDIWVKVNPGFKGDKISLYGTVSGEEIALAELETDGKGFTPGACTVFTVRIEQEIEVKGDLSEHGSANCYIVSDAAMQYSFDATVKGNGLERVAMSFDGAPCDKISDTQLQPESAALLWYNNPDNIEGNSPVVPSSVSYDEATGRISFSTPDNFVEGNAVIAAFDASGAILWSWHIWAVENYDANAEARYAGRYVFMDRNLGATAGPEANVGDNKDAAKALGNYYQWGRKDPFPAASSYTGKHSVPEDWGLSCWTGLPEYKLSDNRIFSGDRVRNGRMLGSTLGNSYRLSDAVDESVRFPHKWMFGGTSDAVWPQYSWFTTNDQFGNRTWQEQSEWRWLWGATQEAVNVKTIYDPCPPGWKVPTADAYVRVLHNAVGANGGHGLYAPAYGLYFPFGGQRKAGFGGSVISNSDDIMMATASTAGSLFPVRASRSESGGGVWGGCITNSNSYAGAGLQVRCVREEVAEKASPYGKQNGHRAALMGDSITRTWRDRGRAAFFTENNYLNRGIDGTTTTNMINRFYGDIVEDEPQLVVIAGGTNDMAQNDGWGSAWDQCVYVSQEELVSNVALMAAIAEDCCGNVVIGSLFPSRDMWWKPQEWKDLYNGDWVSDKIVETTALLKKFAERKGYGYADYHPALKDEQNNLAEKYCWVFGTNPDGSKDLDHVHPNYDAFIVMEGILKPLIDTGLHDPSQGHPGSGGIDDIDKEEWK